MTTFFRLVVFRLQPITKTAAYADVAAPTAELMDWPTWDVIIDGTYVDAGDAETGYHHDGSAPFAWTFGAHEMAFILEGNSTLVADDKVTFGPDMYIEAGDLVSFPAGWTGMWTVHTYMKKRFAFFDAQGVRTFPPRAAAYVHVS